MIRKMHHNRFHSTLLLIYVTFIFISSLLPFSFGWSISKSKLNSNPTNNNSNNNHHNNLQPRRQFLFQSTIETPIKAALSTAILLSSTSPQKACSRNLPESNGADLSQTGSITKLKPIVQMKLLFQNAQTILDSNSSSTSVKEKLSMTICDIPTNEKQFKKLFDEYSDPVSYKQKYMDSNAFLIYYTNGYDGPNRESIEKQEDTYIPKQTLQYGARNDIWNAFDELMVEIKFADENSTKQDFELILNKIIQSLDLYLSYAPKEDVEKLQSQF